MAAGIHEFQLQQVIHCLSKEILFLVSGLCRLTFVGVPATGFPQECILGLCGPRGIAVASRTSWSTGRPVLFASCLCEQISATAGRIPSAIGKTGKGNIASCSGVGCGLVLAVHNSIAASYSVRVGGITLVHTDAPSSRAPGRSRTATAGFGSVVRGVRLVLQDGFDRQQFRFAVAAVARVSCRLFDGVFEADRASGSADALLLATAVLEAGDGHRHAGKIRLRVHSKVASRV